MRVSKQQPCPICHKPNWCLIFKDVALCMRVASPRSYTFKNSGETGYFHTIDGALRPTISVEKKAEPAINVGKLMGQWRDQTTEDMVADLAAELGVQPSSLQRLGCAWAREHRAWAFPMSDGYGNLTGIRLRTPCGNKFAVRGSHAGVFLPGCYPERLAIVCEGPTDTAAALSLGFYAVGRPSCSGGVPHIITAFRRFGVTSAVIIADNDIHGARGGTMLQQQLRIRSALIVLPAKDLREFVHMGGTRELLQSMINNLIYENPA